MSTDTTPLTDEQIVAIRDEHLPSQGDSFDCIAFARAILAATPKAPDPTLHWELAGVIADVEHGNGFDDACLETIKRVHDALAQGPAEPPRLPAKIIPDADYRPIFTGQ